MAELSNAPAAAGTADAQANGAGLIRGVGLLGVVAFGVHAISLAASGQLTFSTVVGTWPGASLMIMLGVALLLSLVHAYTYAVIGTAAPRAGADYYLASRVLSAPLAFASSWVLVVACGLTAGRFVASIANQTLPMLLRSLAYITYDQQWMAAADSASAPENVVLIGTVVVVMAFTSLILSQRAVLRFLQAGLVLGLLAWAVLFYQLLSVPVDSFPAAWNAHLGSGNFLDRIIQARALGMHYVYDHNSTLLAGVMLGFWLFYGAFVSTHFAGEVKNPTKNLLLGSLISLLLTGGIFFGAVYLLQRLVPSEWLAAESFLFVNPAYAGLSMPWVTFYAAIVHPSVPLLLIVGTAWLFMLFNLVQVYLFFISRIITAWADDGLTPFVARYIHPTLRSPLLSVLAAATFALMGVVDTALGGIVLPHVHFVLFVALSQVIPVAAVTLLPFLKPDLFAAVGSLVRWKLGRVPVITLVGGVTLVYLAAVAAAHAAAPAMQSVTTVTWLVFVVLFGWGLGWYYFRRSYLRQQEAERPVQPDGAPAG